MAWVREVAAHFHARYSARARSYRYFIFNRDSRSALAAGRATWERRPLDAPRMHEAAQVLLGEHDFSAFRAVECQAKSPVRRVERLAVTRRGEWLVLDVTANAFLHHMVRNIAGLLISIGHGESPPERVAAVLATPRPPPERRHRATRRTVPGRGALPGGVRAAGNRPGCGKSCRCYHRPHFGIAVRFSVFFGGRYTRCPGSKK